MDDILKRLNDYADVASFDAANLSIDAAKEIVRLRERTPIVYDSDADDATEGDIVRELHDWASIIDGVQGKAYVFMLSGDVHQAAADEIERLRAELFEARLKIRQLELTADITYEAIMARTLSIHEHKPRI